MNSDWSKPTDVGPPPLKVGDTVYRVWRDSRYADGRVTRAPVLCDATIKRVTPQFYFLRFAEGSKSFLAFGCSSRITRSAGDLMARTPGEAWVQAISEATDAVEEAGNRLKAVQSAFALASRAG